MVDDVDTTKRIQAAALAPPAAGYSAPATPATTYLQAITDAVMLSAQARQVLSEISQGQTVAEAWLRQATAPPDLTQPAQASSDSNATGGKEDKNAQAAMRNSMNRTMADLAWLFDAMSPPRVDTGEVAKVLAARMAADSVGTNPPLPQIIARAEQTETTPVLYVENLSVTVGRNGTSASVDRVALTTVDPSLVQSSSATGDRPLVLDVGGQAKKVPTDMLLPAEKRQQEEAERRALLIVRQGGNTLPQGTLHVKLDVLLPLA